MDERVIDPGFGSQTLQAALTCKVCLHDPELELGIEPSVRLRHRASEGLPRRSNRACHVSSPWGSLHAFVQFHSGDDSAILSAFLWVLGPGAPWLDFPE